MAIVVLVFGQLALAYTIARDRFSFVNLVDVATPESFDDPARVIGDARQFDLTFPTDEDFAFEVERGKATLPASDADRFQWAVRWVHSQLEFRRTPSRETIFTPRSAWSATDVLSGSRSGKRYWCDSYARLTASVAHALGLTARVIWLDGHVTVEAYDRERRGWIGADPTLPALLVHPSSAEELSFAQAAALVRSSTPIDVRLLGSETMSASQERSLLYLHRALERDLLAYVDGETAVLGNTPRSLLDWLVGRARGVRMISPSSSQRVWKRQLLVLNSVALIGLFGWWAVGRSAAR